MDEYLQCESHWAFQEESGVNMGISHGVGDIEVVDSALPLDK